MRPTTIITIILGSFFFMTACVPSLNPLYTEQDLIFDKSLIGVWVEKDTRETWELSSSDNKLEYKLLHTDENGRKGEFSARLVKVEDKQFLDIVPIKPASTQSDFYQGHFFATHTFVHVVQKGPTVQLAVLEPRWLKDKLADNPDLISHQKIGGEIVLAATPKETQKFLLANLNTHEAFSQPIELTRKRGTQ